MSPGAWNYGCYLRNLPATIPSQFRLFLPGFEFMYLGSYTMYLLCLFYFFFSFLFICIPTFLIWFTVFYNLSVFCMWLWFTHFYFCVIVYLMKTNKLLFNPKKKKRRRSKLSFKGRVFILKLGWESLISKSKGEYPEV